MNLHPDYRLYSFGPPAWPESIAAYQRAYAEIPPGYFEVVKEMTSAVLLWQLRTELRLWGPDEAIGMDRAYKVSEFAPGAAPVGDNGGGELILYGNGGAGLGLYLVEAGSLFLDEDATFLSRDLYGLLERAEGAESIFRTSPVDAATLGPPIFIDKDYQ